jgi:hypothetical protein
MSSKNLVIGVGEVKLMTANTLMSEDELVNMYLLIMLRNMSIKMTAPSLNMYHELISPFKYQQQ